MMPRHRLAFVSIGLALWALAGCGSTGPRAVGGAAPRAEAPERVQVMWPGQAARTVDPASLPRESFEARLHGRTDRFDGIDVLTLLRATGLPPLNALRTPRLKQLRVAEAADGYRAVFALAELAPTLGGRRVWVVDSQDGAAFDGRDGPWRLTVPADGRAARGLPQLSRLRVVDAP